MKATFRLEKNLVTHFARCLHKGDSPWGRVRIAFEYDYLGGWTDVLALSPAGQLVAFEAKLARWRDALHQAYRTRCFANQSFVVLPDATARVAAQHLSEFSRRRVGLCSVSPDRGIQVLLDAEVSMPFQPWVASRAVDELRRGEKKRCRQTRSSSKSRKTSAPPGS